MSADAEATGVEDAKAPTKITAVLSREEIAELTRASDLRGALSLLTDWGIVAGAMALGCLWAIDVWVMPYII